MSIFNKKARDHSVTVSKEAMDACEFIISEMGAELHDDLIQRLTVLRFSLDRLEGSLSGTESELLFIDIKSQFQEVIQSVRRTSRKLLPLDTEGNSFQQNINVLCQHLETPGIGTVHFDAQGEEQEISPIAETYLFRIIQELIHNSFKHSSAWNVWVRLFWLNEQKPMKLKLEVEDDGSGFSKINEFIMLLSKKHNTLKMRSQVINASIQYSAGAKGLLATVILNL